MTLDTQIKINVVMASAAIIGTLIMVALTGGPVTAFLCAMCFLDGLAIGYAIHLFLWRRWLRRSQLEYQMYVHGVQSRTVQ